MSELKIQKLFNASDKAVKSGVQHVTLVITPDGRFRMNGSSNIVMSINNDPDIYHLLESNMKFVEVGDKSPSNLLVYLLFVRWE